MTTRNKLITALQVILLILIAMAYTELANAHARLIADSATPPRSDNAGIKTGPCGSDPRTTTPSIFLAGQTITVEWEETINHPGWYRIAFSPADDLNFDDYVLLDNIIDDQNQLISNGVYHQFSVQVTLPQMTCEACTLQLIQYMTDRNPPTHYFSCADIQLINNGDITAPEDVTNITATPFTSVVDLSWKNPTLDFFNVMILQDTAPITDYPMQGVTYKVGDSIGTAQVVYQDGGQSARIDTNISSDTIYYFKLFALDGSRNYANGEEISVRTMTEPTLKLSIQQNDVETRTVYQGQGIVKIYAMVDGKLVDNIYYYNWDKTDYRIYEFDTDKVAGSLAFSPDIVSAGTYTVGVTITDINNEQISAADTAQIEIVSLQSDSQGEGNIGMLVVFLMLIILQRYYTTRTRHMFTR